MVMIPSNRKSAKSVKSANFFGVYRKLRNMKTTRDLSFGDTSKKLTDLADLTDHAGLPTGEVCQVFSRSQQTTLELADFLSFVKVWFTGTTGNLVYLAMREVFWCRGDLRECGVRSREPWALEGLDLLFSKFIDDVSEFNIFMGVGFWLITDRLGVPEDDEVNLMMYDRLFYDFDSEGEPEKARDVAVGFAESLRKSYDVVPLVVDSGLKGAHVYVFLSKPIKWDEYRGLWNHLLIKHCSSRELVDRNVLQYNRLARIPYSYNIKEGKKVMSKVIYPKEVSLSDFRFDDLTPLDTSKVKVYTLVGISLPQKVVVTEGGSESIKWIDDLIENGLPDGRKRVLALAIIPYLVNILKLSDEDVAATIKRFLEVSCRNYGRCDEISNKWIQYEVERIREKGYGPIKYEKLEESYKDLYNLIKTYNETLIKTPRSLFVGGFAL